MPLFELSRRAREDLVEIGVYGAARWGDERSVRYVTELYEVCERLADGRSRGRTCERIRPGLWRIEHASHVIFFGDSRPGCSSVESFIATSFRNSTL